MDAVTLIRRQLKWGHETLEQGVADLAPEQRNQRGEGSTIASIAAVYAHAVEAEDWLIRDRVLHEPTLFEREGWGEKTGALPFSASMSTYDDWLVSIRECDFDALRAYAQAVYTATDAYLDSLTPADLERTVLFGPLGDLPLTEFLGVIVGLHTMQHSGEICALKGSMGMKGLPY